MASVDAAALTALRVRPAALDAAQIAEWERLNASIPGMESPFLSPFFARAVAAAGVNAQVCVLMHHGAPCGFLPFQFTGAAAALTGAAVPIGDQMSDYAGLVAEPTLRITSARLLQLARLNNFNFSHLDQTQLSLGLSGEQPRIGLRLRLAPTDPLAHLMQGQQRYQKDSERCAAKLEKEIGPLAFNFDQRDDLPGLLEQLMRHKRAQYARTGTADALASEWTRRLLHLLAATDSQSCRGQMSTLYAGGKWLASHFGLVGNGVLHHWMPVYNPEFSKYAPGRLLMHKMIEACPRAGLHTIDHGEGDSPNKRQVSNEEHMYYRGAWHNRSALSLATRAYHSLKWRFQDQFS